MPKILVIGDKGVGKTTFISKIADYDNSGNFKLTYKVRGKNEKVEFEFLENKIE